LITKTLDLKLKLGYLSFTKKIKIFQKDVRRENETECFLRRGNCRPKSGRIQKYTARLLEEFQARFDYLQELKSCFLFPENPFNDIVGDGCPARQSIVTNLSAVEMKLTEIQDGVALKVSVYSIADFWRQVPKSKYPEFKIPVAVYDTFLHFT